MDKETRQINAKWIVLYSQQYTFAIWSYVQRTRWDKMRRAENDWQHLTLRYDDANNFDNFDTLFWINFKSFWSISKIQKANYRYNAGIYA